MSPSPKRRTWRRFVQFRLRTLLLLTLVAAVAMFFYTRLEVVEEQPMPGYRVKRQIYRTEDGKPVAHGWWEMRDADGRLICEGGYRHDKPHGKWTWRHASGRLRQQGEYREGRRHGLWKTWYDDGQPREEFTYEDGVLHGPARSWWPGGFLAAEGEYAAGLRTGQWMIHNEQGRTREAGAYENDLREGPWQGWDAEGNELTTQHYAAGRAVPDDARLVAAWRERLLGAGYARRAEAAWALGRLGERGIAVLDEAARGDDSQVRSLAIVELSKHSTWAKANVPRVIAALDEPSRQVHLAVMLSLSALGPEAKEAVPKLEQLLKVGGDTIAGDNSYDACVLATLISIAPERDDLVERFVPVGSELGGWTGRNPFLDHTRVAAHVARSAAPGICRAVKASNPDVRVKALYTLQTMVMEDRFPASAEIGNAITGALSDADASVRRAACDVLGWGRVVPLEQAQPLLQQATNDSDPEVAKAAQEALSRLQNGPSAGFGGIGQGFGSGFF